MSGVDLAPGDVGSSVDLARGDAGSGVDLAPGEGVSGLDLPQGGSWVRCRSTGRSMGIVGCNAHFGSI